MEPASANEQESGDAGIALALSGGGNRAALFNLGVLLYLVDSGINRHVEVMSSVSGGSITNGFVAQECDFRTVEGEAFERIAADLVRRIVYGGLTRTREVVLFVLALVLCFGLTGSMFILQWPAAVPGWMSALLLMACGTLALLRGNVIGLAMARRFFMKDGRRTLLADLDRSVDHVFCATDLNSNAPFVFSSWAGGAVYSPALGMSPLQGTRLAALRLDEAVRASAAFPGGLPPKRLRLGDVHYDFNLTHLEAAWQVQNTKYRKAGDYRPRWLFLADGGVWNNLGTQALVEHHAAWNWKNAAPWRERVEDMRWIVADASAPVRAASMWRLHVPLVAEASALLRSINILTFNTVYPRVARLRENRNRAVVSITEDRTRGLERVTATGLAAEHPEDRELVEWSRHGIDLEHWSELRILDGLTLDGLRRMCGDVPTTLGRIAPGDAATLLVHGYQNAFAEIYSKFPYPRPNPRPFMDRFHALVKRR